MALPLPAQSINSYQNYFMFAANIIYHTRDAGLNNDQSKTSQLQPTQEFGDKYLTFLPSVYNILFFEVVGKLASHDLNFKLKPFGMAKMEYSSYEQLKL